MKGRLTCLDCPLVRRCVVLIVVVVTQLVTELRSAARPCEHSCCQRPCDPMGGQIVQQIHASMLPRLPFHFCRGLSAFVSWIGSSIARYLRGLLRQCVLVSTTDCRRRRVGGLLSCPLRGGQLGRRSWSTLLYFAAVSTSAAFSAAPGLAWPESRSRRLQAPGMRRRAAALPRSQWPGRTHSCCTNSR